jgi:hypothetical protein
LEGFAAPLTGFQVLFVEDAAACRHPLRPQRPYTAVVAERVFVMHLPGKHIRQRFDASMRMAREADARLGGASDGQRQMIQQQKRIEQHQFLPADCAANMHPFGLLDIGGIHDDPDRTHFHRVILLRSHCRAASTSCSVREWPP